MGVVDIEAFERGSDVSVGTAFILATNSLTSFVNSVIRCSFDFNVVVNDLTYRKRLELRLNKKENILFYLLFVSFTLMNF